MKSRWHLCILGPLSRLLLGKEILPVRPACVAPQEHQVGHCVRRGDGWASLCLLWQRPFFLGLSVAVLQKCIVSFVGAAQTRQQQVRTTSNKIPWGILLDLLIRSSARSCAPRHRDAGKAASSGLPFTLPIPA